MSAGNWPGHHNADGQPMCTCRAPRELLYVDSALHAGFSLLVFLNADVHSIWVYYRISKVRAAKTGLLSPVSGWQATKL